MRHRGDGSEGRQRNAARKHEHPCWTGDREEVSTRSSTPPQHRFLFVSLTLSLLCCALLFFFCSPLSSFVLLTNSLFFFGFFHLGCPAFIYSVFHPVFFLSLFFNLSLHLLYFCWFNLCYFLLRSHFHLMPYALSIGGHIFISAIYSSHQILISFLAIAASDCTGLL